jgi:hypothetical protein
MKPHRSDPGHGDRVFSRGEIELDDRLPDGAGLLLLATTSPAGAHPVGRYHGAIVAFQALDEAATLVDEAFRALAAPAVEEVALRAGEAAADAGLTLAFAQHLDAVRRARGQRSRGCVTAWAAPVVGDGRVRLPHLVTVREPPDRLRDIAVWEAMELERAHDWLGGELPDQRFFEDRLETLLELRGRARAGAFPDTSAGRRLEALLTGGRRLSILLVYRNAELFRELLSAPSRSGL